MKIAVITSGILPIPAVQGGAVENLIDFYLAYNEQYRLHDITTYSVYHPSVRHHRAQTSTVNHYEYIKTGSLWFRILAKLYSYHNPKKHYFHDIEFFFELVWRKMRKQQFDVIILENRPGFALKLHERTTTPLIAHIHTDLLHVPTENNREIVRITKKFLAVSNYIKNEIEYIDGAHNIAIVYNGLDTSTFNPASVKPVDRTHLGLKDEDFVIVYTGRLVEAKGIKDLMAAIQLLSDYPDIKLMVVGGNNFADSSSADPFVESLKQQMRDISDRIVFTGFIPYHQLPSYLASANVAAVPSHINEAFGMTCIEATAMGLPVIATNDGGIPETLVGQKHILVDKDGDLPQELAKAILKVRNNYADYQGNRLNPKFTKEVYAKTFFENINIQ